MRAYPFRVVVSVLCVLTILTGCSINDSSNTKGGKDISEFEYTLVSKKVFHLLLDEYLDTNDPRYDPPLSVLNRVYRVYDGIEHRIYEVTDGISMTNEIKTILQARKYLIENYPESLLLRPLTIVNVKVLNQWKNDGYKAENEYWSDSPKGLTFVDITK